MFPGKTRTSLREQWIADSLHNLKHKHGAAKRLLNEFNKTLPTVRSKHKAELETVITYFTNNYKKMNYDRQTKDNMPIGSGVVEAACKELIKQRLVNSGMRWNNAGAAIVIAIRSLILSNKRWAQFWQKIDNSGCPAHRDFTEI